MKRLGQMVVFEFISSEEARTKKEKIQNSKPKITLSWVTHFRSGFT